jgi:hypothetical protein
MPSQEEEDKGSEPGSAGASRFLRVRTALLVLWPAVLLIFLAFAACEFKTEARVNEQAVVAQPARADAPPVEDPPPSQEEARVSAAEARARELTDAARFFAGMPVDERSDFSGLTGSDIWECNARRTEALWDGFPKVRARMEAWAKRELTAVFDPTAPLFYPFSGPDIVFPLIFFPCAREYILIGLEPVGDVLRRRGLSPQRLDEMLSTCAVAVQDLVRLSFYRTKVMEPEFSETALRGVLPVLMVSLARMGMDVLEVERGDLDEGGAFVPLDEDSPESASAVRVEFRKAGEVAVQSLTYFSSDLSNGGLKKEPAFAAYLANAGRCFTFLKSASYLCRKSYFSRIRKAILDKSYAVLQDDSGLAFASFVPETWKVSLYGTYDGPVKLFEDHFEQDLWEAMKNGAKPLNFRFGYSRASCLTLAAKKSRN